MRVQQIFIVTPAQWITQGRIDLFLSRRGHVLGIQAAFSSSAILLFIYVATCHGSKQGRMFQQQAVLKRKNRKRRLRRRRRCSIFSPYHLFYLPRGYDLFVAKIQPIIHPNQFQLRRPEDARMVKLVSRKERLKDVSMHPTMFRNGDWQGRRASHGGNDSKLH